MALAAAIAFFVFQANGPALAQSSDTQWRDPVVLFDASSAASAANPRIVFYPFVVVDTEDQIKILWEVSLGPETDSTEFTNGIYCIEGDGTAWSEAIDVIVAPGAGHTFWPQHSTDAAGRIHLVWTGPNGRLYYSLAPSSEACRAPSWQTIPLPIADQVLYGNITVDESGIIHVVYAVRARDVYYISSIDDGLSWTDPVAVSNVPSVAATSFPSIAVDTENNIHVAWEENQLPNGVPALGLFYAVSRDSGQTWSEPLMIADGGHTQPAIAVLDDGTVHLLWNGRAGISGRYHQWSADGGSSWSLPIEFISKEQGGGQTGYPRFATDSLDRLHVVSGTEAVTYIVWNGQQWIDPPLNVLGYLEYPNIAIGNGREMHLAASDFQRIIYLRGLASAPEVEATFMLTPPSESKAAPVGETLKPQDTPFPRLAQPLSFENVLVDRRQMPAYSPIVFGVSLTAAFLVVAVLAMIGRKG